MKGTNFKNTHDDDDDDNDDNDDDNSSDEKKRKTTGKWVCKQNIVMKTNHLTFYVPI